MALIAIIFLAFAVIFVGVEQHHLESVNSNASSLQRMTTVSAKEFSQFTSAIGNYVQSVGLPLPGTVLTVQDLQQSNLLPSSFPLQTPFGQTLVAAYEPAPNNPYALDVVVHTTGTMSEASLSRSGLNNVSMSTVQYETAIAAQNQIPTTITGSTGQFFGVGDGSTLESLGSSSYQALPSGIDLQQPEVAEFILSPGQYGYWLFNMSLYGGSTVWEMLCGWVPSTNTAYVNYNGISAGGPSLQSQGFSLTCPSVANQLGSLSNNQYIGNNDTLYSSYSTSPSGATQDDIFCIPAYKGQVQNVNIPLNYQVFSTELDDYSVNWNGQYYIHPKNITSDEINSSSGTAYVDPSSIYGLNNNLYAAGKFFTVYQPAPNYPSNEAGPMPMPNAMLGSGLSVKVRTPQNTTDTYQIEIDAGSLFTGTGCEEALVDPFTQNYADYDTWASSKSSQNLCNSQETYWTDWHAVKNSDNLSAISVSQNYESYGNSYTLSFSVPTPLLN